MTSYALFCVLCAGVVLIPAARVVWDDLGRPFIRRMIRDEIDASDRVKTRLSGTNR